jgi:hypothetical protein
MDTVTAKMRITIAGEKRTLAVLPVVSGSAGEVVPCDVYISRSSLNNVLPFRRFSFQIAPWQANFHSNTTLIAYPHVATYLRHFQ